MIQETAVMSIKRCREIRRSWEDRIGASRSVFDIDCDIDETTKDATPESVTLLTILILERACALRAEILEGKRNTRGEAV
jgi:hypothetical protein